MEQKEPWKRLLWRKQDYPDNYTDPKFMHLLEELRQQKHHRPLILCSNVKNYRVVQKDFLAFYHEVLNISFIYIIFSYIHYYHRDPIMITVLITMCVLSLSHLSQTADSQLRSLLNPKSITIITFTMLTLSPVLKSLSKTTASDSIWTLSFWFTLSYIFSISKKSRTNASNVSTNLLLTIVTLLASRLPTAIQVFCFLYICIQLNIIMPTLSIYSSSIVSLFSNAIFYSFLAKIVGYAYTSLLVLLTLFYAMVLPRWFLYCQCYYGRCFDESEGSKNEFVLKSTWDAKVPILD